MIPIEPDDCLAMRWPLSLGPEPSIVASEYTLRIEVNERDFKTVQKAIGFDVAEDDWAQLTHSLVAGLMVFAQVRDSHEAVAVSAAEQRASGIAELGWVAVAPGHRGRGLGSAICSELTRRLVDARQKIFLSTQDHRVEAKNEVTKNEAQEHREGRHQHSSADEYQARLAQRLDEISDAAPCPLEGAHAHEEAFDVLVVSRVPDSREDVVKRGLGAGERVVFRAIRQRLQKPKLADHRFVCSFGFFGA